MDLFTFPLFCCTMILPVIFVRQRVVKGVPYNSFVVNNAYKKYKCALKCLFVGIRAILGHLSEMGEVFSSQTIDCKKGSDWLTRWVETQHNIYVVNCFMIGQ